MATLDDASVAKRRADDSDGASPKRPRQVHDEDADTVSAIAEHSEAASDQGDDLCSEPDAEAADNDSEAKKPLEPSETPRYAPFRLADDKKSMWVRCNHCQTQFRTDLIETLLKPVDVEVYDMDEIDGGHLAWTCSVIFKRRTMVRCSTCDRDVKIANNLIDDAAGEVLGEAIRVATQEGSDLEKQLHANITSVERQYTLTSLSTLFGSSQ